MQARKHKNHPKSRRVESSDLEGEVFNLDATSDRSSVDDASEPVAKAAPTQAKRTGRSGHAVPTAPSSTAPRPAPPNASEQAAALLQPFIPTTASGSGRSNRANDTKYFFLHGEVVEKGIKVTKQICRACQ
jgi:hypothetical protein